MIDRGTCLKSENAIQINAKHRSDVTQPAEDQPVGL